MPVGDHQVEPLLVMDDVALSEVLPKNLRGDLSKTLASQLVM